MKVDHIGVATPSIEEALKFWRDALGLEVGHTETVEEQGVHVAMLPVGEPRVELLEPTGPASPVAKFLDIGRYKYEAQKKANEQRKRQKTQEIKEIKMRPNIDDHDYQTKMKKVFEFLEEGDKVKLTLRFRGREMAHNQLGMAVLQRVAEDTSKIAKIEQHPRLEGRQMLMVISPK